MKKPATVATVLAFLALGATVRADEWDVGNDTDNAITTDNSLFHGAEQIHDMGILGPGVSDQDWYLVSGRKFSSYQVVVDGMTGDLDFTAANVQLTDDGGVVVQNGLVTDSSGQLTLNWKVFSDTVDNYVRVGPFATREEAERLRYMLAGPDPSLIEATGSRDDPAYRVRLGPFDDADAASAMARIAGAGFEPEASPESAPGAAGSKR